MSHRYPFAPLATAMGMTEHAAARTLGLSGSSYKSHRTRGVTELVADRLAVKAGLHPFEVWPEMAQAAVDEATERRRESWRRYAAKRRTDPAYRAARAEYMRAYRAEARDVLRAQKRRWDRNNIERRRELNREAMRRLRARRKDEAA